MFSNFRAIDTQCEGVTYFPAIEADQNCTRFPLYESQICGIVIVPKGSLLPEDWTSLTDWSVVIDNRNTNNTKGKYLTGSGSLPAPEKATPTIGKGVRWVAQRKYTVSFRVFNVYPDQYNFLVTLQKGVKNFTFWYENLGGHLWGGPQGLTPSFVDVDFPLEGERGSYEYADITLQFVIQGEPVQAFSGGFENFLANLGCVLEFGGEVLDFGGNGLDACGGQYPIGRSWEFGIDTALEIDTGGTYET